MSKLDNWIDNKIVQNTFVWVFLLLVFTMVIQAENRLLASIIFIAFILPPVYINNLKILPLFFKKKIELGSILFLLNISFFTFLGVLFLSSFFDDFDLKMLLNVFGGLLLILIFGTALKLARDSFIRRQEEKNAELKLLKAQLNPHFLFNTLNNLYGLSVVRSDKLPGLMLKLSDLLRYSLYDTKEMLAPLDKEIQYLENYMSLERIRLEEKTKIQLDIKGDVPSKKIAPMLLIVFVENAFKHLGELESEKNKVLVSLKIEEDNLIFTCVNTLGTFQVKEQNIEKGKSGIGLKNVKKRLDLIYSGKYKLILKEEKENYVVKLTLTF